MYLIGLTGNIATGKTSVCAILQQLGAQIIDADQLVHRLLRRGQPVYDQVVAAFGHDILAGGEIDRARLGRIVFADPAALRRLELITHPAVDELVQKEVAASRAPVVVVDAVKLLESGLARRCHAVWVVTAPEQQQFERLTTGRGMTAADAWQRIRAQSPQADKVRQADVVIDNSGTLAETEAQVRRAWRRRGEGETRGRGDALIPRYPDTLTPGHVDTLTPGHLDPGHPDTRTLSQGGPMMKMIAQAAQEPVVRTPDGAQRRILSYGGGLMAVQFTFEAGVTSAWHSHPHEQIGYVISGEIDIVMDGRDTVRLKAGGSYYVPSNIKHNIVTYAPSVLLDCFTPVRQDFLT